MEEQNSAAPNKEANSIDPGYVLAQARLKANLTTEQVADKLHLSPKRVTALESNNFGELPEATYVRGYIRNYAHLVGVSSDPLIDAFNTITAVKKKKENFNATGQHKASAAVASDARIIKIIAIFFAVVALGITVFFVNQGEDGSTGQEEELMASGSDSTSADATMEPQELLGPPQLAMEEQDPNSANTAGIDTGGEAAAAAKINDQAVAVPAPAKTEIAKPKASSNVFGSSKPAADVAVQSPTVANERSTPIQEAPVVEKEEVATTAQKSQIVLYVEADSWADVRDADGNKLVYETVASGRIVTVEGIPPFRIFLGNVDGVKLFYNGKEYNVAQHKRGLVARFVLGKQE
ncbi:MAG: DUF4115 domain-containing protein [Gammaproteobacteria bacterium]|nr:DUF4115 domain-containing protein [Gammaproteobacteria bacterium]